MSISLQADPTAPQGYILVNGTTAATIDASGVLTTTGLNSTNVNFSQGVITSNVNTGTLLQIINTGTGGHIWDICSNGSANAGGAGALQIYDATTSNTRLLILPDGTINTQGNSITNCPTTAKAWVNFTGVVTIFSGTYTQSGTSVTVSGNNFQSIGFAVGTAINFNPTTGSAILGTYVVTAVTTTSMTFTGGSSTTTSGNYTLTSSMVRSSYNVSSVTKNGTGSYTVNFATPMADANFCALATSYYSASYPNGYIALEVSRGATYVQISSTNTQANGDVPFINVAVFGN
jgi:hypothetical protein